jgi:hypothetical protein
MKNLTPMFLALFIIVGAGSSALFAQGNANDENIWSIVKIDPNEPEKIESPNWVPVEPIVRYYNLGDGITVFPNFRPKPTTNTTQSEMSVDVHPTNNNIVFGSANASNWPVSTIYGTGVYWSTDGATNWTGFDNPPFGSNAGDPVSVIGSDGKFYENYISSSYGQGVAVSTNNGVNWSTYIVAPNPGSLADKNHFMVDKTPTSPYVNRAYCVWTDFGGANNYDAVVRYSINFGQTWSASINLSNALASYLNQGANVQTGPNGEVYATWTVYIGSNVNDGEDGIGFAKSTDGGVTWTAPIYAYQQTNFGVRTTSLPGKGLRCNSFPSMTVDRSGGPNNGTIYITWAQRGVAPAGSDPDIVLVKSTNGGTTWTSPVRVNDDPLSNGKDQIFPWCTVDQANGQLLLVFYDSRNVPNNQAEVFMARSANGGVTFENFVVSDQAFVLDPISGFSGNYAGDYIGVAAYDEVAYPYWMDERTGNAQGWMAVVNFGPPCPIDPPSNPSPANGATNIPIIGNTASWANGAGANQIEIWFGEGSNLAQVYNGSPITSFSLAPVEPLLYNTTYGWQIVGKNDTCNVNGPVWTFTTMPDPNLVIDTLFCEAFEGGLGGWTVTNDGGTCVWQIRFAPFPNSYTLPSTSTGGIMTADVDECGSGTTLLSTATLNQSFDLSQYTSMVWIEFDNDWNVIDAQDEAHVELSTNGGTTWTGVWDQIGSDILNTHEVVDITSFVSGQSNVKFRLRSVQPGWDWWWVLDNFCIYGMYIVPVELTSFTTQVIKDGVELNWRTATETNNQGFDIERMNTGGVYEKIGYVAGFGTTTEPKTYSFTDSKLDAGTYTYRLKQMDFNGSYSYSDEVNVDVALPLEYALEQNYPNPFNPSTTIKYSIAEDGFVKLAVYNMLGEEVATIVNNVQKAGRYEINFNASGLSSGVYVYRIESANYTSSKKLMLMK